MTAIALMFGSVLGMFSAAAGWLFLDLTALSAFALYLGISLGLALIAAVAQSMQDYAATDL